MKSLKALLFSLLIVGLIACSSSTGVEENDKIRYVVEDLSKDPVQKKIEFKVHDNGPIIVVRSTKAYWKRSVDVDDNVDLKLKSTVIPSGLIPMKVSIYINDELKETKQFKTVHSLTINHIR